MRTKNIKVSDLAKAFTEVLQGNFAPKEQSAARYEICLNCPTEDFDKETKQCILCSCFMKHKTKLLNFQCPKKHWN